MIFNAVQAVHDCGVEHRDLHDRNIVFDNSLKHAYIIDFGHAMRHECEHPPICPGQDKPLPLDFECEELYKFASKMRVWLDYGA